MPDVGLGDETIGLDCPLCPGFEPQLVGDLEHSILPQRLLDGAQVRNRFPGFEPALRVKVDALPHPFSDPAAGGRESCRQLEQGGLQLVVHAQLCKRRRDAEHEQGAHLVTGQPGERRPVAVEQRTTTTRPALGIDGNARHAQGI